VGKSSAFSQPFVEFLATSSLDKWQMVHHFPEPGSFSMRPRGEVWKWLLKIKVTSEMENGLDIHLADNSAVISSSTTEEGTGPKGYSLG